MPQFLSLFSHTFYLFTIKPLNKPLFFTIFVLLLCLINRLHLQACQWWDPLIHLSIQSFQWGRSHQSLLDQLNHESCGFFFFFSYSSPIIFLRFWFQFEFWVLEKKMENGNEIYHNRQEACCWKPRSQGDNGGGVCCRWFYYLRCQCILVLKYWYYPIKKQLCE